EHWSYGLRPG
nr:gonadotropin-releasing hormone, GnRH [Acipenser gueldenstaedti=Russian sturgeon, Brandt, brain, Peptide, 10 aa] [Acipenser gueldenstaedtii]prf//1714374A luliberin,9-Hyp [Mus musculus]